MAANIYTQPGSTPEHWTLPNKAYADCVAGMNPCQMNVATDRLTMVWTDHLGAIHEIASPWDRNSVSGYTYLENLTDRVGIGMTVPLDDFHLRGTSYQDEDISGGDFVFQKAYAYGDDEALYLTRVLNCAEGTIADPQDIDIGDGGAVLYKDLWTVRDSGDFNDAAKMEVVLTDTTCGHSAYWEWLSQSTSGGGAGYASLLKVGYDSGVVINEDSNNLFAGLRVEGATDDYLLFVDSPNNRIGIGTAIPGSLLEVSSASAAPIVTVNSTVAGAGGTVGGRLDLGLNGSVGAPNLAGDFIGQLAFIGQGDDATFAGGIIDCEIVVGNDTRSNMSSKLNFKTMAIGAVIATTKTTLDENGNLGIGVTDPDTKLEVLNAGTQAKFSYNGTDYMTIGADDNGNAALVPSGVAISINGVPSDWDRGASWSVLQINDIAFFDSDLRGYFGHNVYVDNTDTRFEYISNLPVELIQMGDATMFFKLAASGSADDPISFSNILTLSLTEVSIESPISLTGTARINWNKHVAQSITITTGSSSDVVGDLQIAHDGSVFTLDENGGTPGMDAYVEFTNVVAFDWVQILGYYDGLTSHFVQTQLYDWVGAGWDDFNNITTIAGDMLRELSFFVPDDSVYIGTGGDEGKVRVRFYHPSNGTGTHDLVLDVVALYQ